ncbi:PACE efflux transporter [Ideonella sp. NS12-5]|uniref:PACE efflux transporter n=2 Tax=Ideonella oryzae TaxID=2937441 RepID=A0ABT1BGZ1_9BURK|nr:PACE efflux transporter [Ideonella oryzae]MCO5975495.1 PACE efflux transporter [Ideonella oryzae]
MTPLQRRVLQAVLYETGAIALTGPIVGLSFDVGAGSSLLLAVIMSSIALAWNYVFNAGFEHWERRQVRHQRTVWRRLMHGIGFEGGLGLMLVPLMAVWLDIPLWQALVAEIGLLALFFLYAVGFTWAFDRVFGLPESARG